MRDQKAIEIYINQTLLTLSNILLDFMPTSNAPHPKGKKQGPKWEIFFPVQNNISSAWKQQYILYYLGSNRFRRSGGRNWQVFFHMNLADNIADFIILEKKSLKLSKAMEK